MFRQSLDVSPLFTLQITAVFLLFAFVDYLWRRRRGLETSAEEIKTTALVSIGQRLVNPLLGASIVLLLQFVFEHRLFTFDWRQPWAIALLVLGEEFTYYWFHRSSHERRWLWSTHSVHHSPRVLTLLASFRLGWTGVPSGNWLFFLPLIWLGYPPAVVFGTVGLNLLYQFWLHTESIGKLGWFEYVFNTPSHHRVHHSNQAEYLNRNYGGVVIFFDRLFGTYAEEKEGVKHTYGLVGADRRGLFNVVFGEWVAMFQDMRKADGVGAKMKVAFGKWE